MRLRKILNGMKSLQVSDTENIRKNLAIERMIIEGCDILLDVNQMFVRQGTVIQASEMALCIYPPESLVSRNLVHDAPSRNQPTALQILGGGGSGGKSSSGGEGGKSRMWSGGGRGDHKEREAVRQCFLFSNHLIITSR